MTREQAKEFMWKENDKNPSKIQWQHHKTIRDLHDSLIAKIYDDEKTKKCINCIFCDEVRETIIHCEKFEQYMPIEIGRCDMWEQK